MTPGWYNAQGDPPGTQRYWDGSQWIGEPVPTPQTGPGGYSAGGYNSATSSRLNFASPGSRIGARLIDTLTIFMLVAILFIPAISGMVSDINDLGGPLSETQVLGIVGIGILLWELLWVSFVGGTPGKLVLGLRVARADTGATPPGFGKAALRMLNRLLTFIPGLGGLLYFLIGLVSFIMLFTDDQHRTVMDRIASTVVIKK